MKKFDIISQEYAHKGFFDLRIDLLENQSGDQMHYTVLMTKADAVAILAQRDDGKYLLTEEFRHPVGRTLLSCPGGRMEVNELPHKAVAREFLEETGHTCTQFIPLGTYYPLPAICDQKIFLFYGTGASKQKEKSLEPFESLNLVFLEEEKLLQMAEKTDIDGVLTNLLFRTFLFKRKDPLLKN
jgi:ADP-ribose pyrophosphatase